MKKLIISLLFLSSFQLAAITSNMTHRIMSTSPLLYKMIDYSKHEVSFEAEPIYMNMYQNQQAISSMMLSGKKTLEFDQQGNGDFNPMAMNLMSINENANYNSQVTFTPSMTQSGMLLHWYDNFENMFIDVKTALIQCKSEIAITEVGGGNGLIPGVLNAQQAFTQDDWNYGKIGQANHVTGLDNIELRFGGVTKATSYASTYDLFITGFGIIEAPTGTGTKAEWLFEPQVGTNHWGLGFGFEALVCGDDDLKFMIAGNFRYLTPAWETRSFDLLDNGQWSRYLGVQNTYGLPVGPATLTLPGINFFTQQAYIKGRSQLNLYTRLSKKLRSSLFELSYNFFCLQQESIGTIKNPTPGYGIYAMNGRTGGSGGVTTASKATINESITNFDPIGSPETITADNFNKFSATQGTYVTNTLAARLEIMQNNIVYGFGAAIEAGLSNNALSTWSVWAKFGYEFDNIISNDCNHEYAPRIYEINSQTGVIEHNEILIDEANFPQNLMTNIEKELMDDLDSFEFIEDENSLILDSYDEDDNNNEILEPGIIEEIEFVQENNPEEILNEEEEKSIIYEETTGQALEEIHNLKEDDPTLEESNDDQIENQTLETISLEDDHEILPIAEIGIILKNENRTLLPTEENTLELNTTNDTTDEIIPLTETISIENEITPTDQTIFIENKTIPVVENISEENENFATNETIPVDGAEKAAITLSAKTLPEQNSSIPVENKTLSEEEILQRLDSSK